MKKICFILSVAFVLSAMSCGTTGNVAENSAQPAPEAPVSVATDTQDAGAQESDEQTQMHEDKKDSGDDNSTNDDSAENVTATDESSDTVASNEDTQSENNDSQTAETSDESENLEIIAQEDVLQNEPSEDDSTINSNHVTEPEVFDTPAVIVEYNHSAKHELAETEPDAQGTTPVAQPTANSTANDSTLSNETTQTAPIANTTVPAQNSSSNRTTSPNGYYANETTETLKTNETPAQTQTASAQKIPETVSPAQTDNIPVNNTGSQADDTLAQNSSAQNAQSVAENAVSENEQTDTLIPLEPQKAVPSRSVTIKNNQYLDIVYPGSGWVYLGEAEENRDQKKQPLFSYFGRKLGTTDTTFTLRSCKPGSTLLHFYKNDALTGQYIDDYLAVTIEAENAKAGVRATAPSYAEAVPPKPTRQTRSSYQNVVSNGTDSATTPENQQNTSNTSANQPSTGNQQNTNDSAQASVMRQTSQSSANTVIPAPEDKGVKTVIQTTESAPSGESNAISSAPAYSGTSANKSSPKAGEQTQTADTDLDLLEQAKRSYAAKQYETALNQVQQYLQDATKKIDEALYLQGQVLEAESSVKSIRSAIDSYETLTKNYPMSSLWGKANNRIIYLKRFYIEIR